VKKHNVVYVRILYGLGGIVLDEYTASICSRLSEDGDSIFFQNSICTRFFDVVSSEGYSFLACWIENDIMKWRWARFHME
jgi:hypothetical protein